MRRTFRRKLSQQQFRRKLAAVVVFIAFYSLGVLHLYTRDRIPPHTRLGQMDVSGRTKTELEQRIGDELNRPVKLQINERVYDYSYADLGVGIDTELAWSHLIAPGQRQFPVSIWRYFTAFARQRTVPPPLTYSVDYSRYVDETVFDFGPARDTVQVDAKEKIIEFQEHEQRYTLDDGSLKGLLAYHFGEEQPVLTPFLKKLNNTKKETIYSHNELLRLLFSKPVTVILRWQEKPLTFRLLTADIKRMTAVHVDPDTADLSVSLDDAVFADIMSQYVQKLRLPAERRLAMKPARDTMERILRQRMEGNIIDYLEASIDDGPNTAGNLAEKYIEVDISQQRMYLFDHGSIHATYRISSGAEYPTPVGSFTIMNKAENAFSSIYNVWMPYWMGFFYSNEVNAMIGIHELPYSEAENGIRSPQANDQIGAPSTGGCIALEVGAAQEVFTFADVGTPVYIYN